MNILVKTQSGHIVIRPDTTWEKDNEDFFPPEFVNRVTYSPVVFARILKPGRSIGKKFASRYYDAVNFGVLLYPEDIIDGSMESYAQAICLDHISFLPAPFFQPLTLSAQGNTFELRRNGKLVFFCGSEDDKPEGETSEMACPPASVEMIENAIVEATKMAYIRTGDLIAIELDERRPLVTRDEGSVRISGEWCSNKTIDFSVNF